MIKENIEDKNLFMICHQLNPHAFSKLPKGYVVRNCRKNELDIWKRMHFDDEKTANEYYPYMTRFFHDVYGKKENLFYEKCLFVCNENDVPVGTCFAWKAYDEITTIHWFKVVKDYEGLGIGRALLSIVMKSIDEDEYPVYLHTQPGSYRAIKLYSDFGFALLTDPIIGNRKNDLEESLPYLKKMMHKEDYENLKFAAAPKKFLKVVKSAMNNEF